MSKNSISVRGVKKLYIIFLFPLKKPTRTYPYFPATVINFCQKKYPLVLISHFSHVQQHANCVACLQTWVVFAFLSEVTHAAVIGEVFSFMVVQPWLRFQVLAIYIYHCGIFSIPSFLSEKKKIYLLPYQHRLHKITCCFICLDTVFTKNFLPGISLFVVVSQFINVLIGLR